MGTTSETAPLSNLQRELLKLFAKNVSEEDLIAIRQLIARYFAEKAMDLADQVWEEKGWTEEDAIRLANTKMRTPYNPNQE
ncbi:MAG: hypothetical protein KDD02_09010 [Phaeodactylibacter sp.]|nr:hypothetical protein [Phaeodactylibacter sp.]MCB9299014.1 hypothetical protein [Lewinellaceae bacterium]